MIQFFVGSNKHLEPILLFVREQPITVDSDPDRPVTAWHDSRVMVGFREANLKWMKETRARTQASLRIVKGLPSQVDEKLFERGNKMSSGVTPTSP